MANTKRPLNSGMPPRKGYFGSRFRKGLQPGLALFPVTLILDNFNRANEGPPPSASWTNPDLNAGLKVISNTCGNNEVQGAASIWNTVFNANQEAYLSVATLPAEGQYIELSLRNQSLTNLDNRYVAQFTNNGVSNATVGIILVSGGSSTPLGTTFDLGVSLAVSQQLGFRVVGSTLSVWFNGTSLGTRSDGTITGAGRLAVRCGDETQRVDNFGGGNV